MNVRQHWRALVLGGALLALLALARLVRDAPIQSARIRIDSLAVFFAFATLAALATTPTSVPRRVWLAGALLLIAYSVTLTPAIAALCAAATLVAGGGTQAAEETEQRAHRDTRSGGRWALVGAARRVLGKAAPLVAAAALLLGYGALTLGGAWHYDDRAAGAALNSLAFWFVLLPVTLAVTPFAELHGTPTRSAGWSAWYLVFVGLCYPLVRLYSLGPWNTGWAYATLLLGGAAALWSALASLGEARAEQRLRHIHRILAALALAGFGLDTGAGIAAGCYGMLALLVVRAGVRGQESGALHSPAHRRTRAPALVFIAPFVALWMLLGAALAGGAQALAGAAWLAALLGAVALLLGGGSRRGDDYSARVGAASAALGVGAPLVVLWLIEPVIEQLQGGLTPYGDVIVWPWVGVAFKNSANAQVATLPSVFVAGLLLVLAAIIYLVARIYEPPPALEEPIHLPADAPSRFATIVRLLRAEVPWLDLLLPPEHNGARHLDGE